MFPVPSHVTLLILIKQTQEDKLHFCQQDTSADLENVVHSSPATADLFFILFCSLVITLDAVQGIALFQEKKKKSFQCFQPSPTCVLFFLFFFLFNADAQVMWLM